MDQLSMDFPFRSLIGMGDLKAIYKQSAVSNHKTEGIQAKRKKILWTDIAQMRVVNEILEVVPKKKGLFGRISAQTWQIVNLDALFALSDEMIKQANQIQ